MTKSTIIRLVMPADEAEAYIEHAAGLGLSVADLERMLVCRQIGGVLLHLAGQGQHEAASEIGDTFASILHDEGPLRALHYALVIGQSVDVVLDHPDAAPRSGHPLRCEGPSTATTPDGPARRDPMPATAIAHMDGEQRADLVAAIADRLRPAGATDPERYERDAERMVTALQMLIAHREIC